MSPENLHNIIKEYSAEMGFVAYGSIPVSEFHKDASYLRQYLDMGYNASMSYLEKNFQIRENPGLLLEGAKSIMVFLASYKPDKRNKPEVPVIASYAFGRDYHPVIKNRLNLVAKKLKEYMPGIRYRVFTDSAPIFERAAAVAAGLGFIGRNTFLISKEHGLHTLIGVIITDAIVPYNSDIVSNGCGTCRRCLDTCPTGALAGEFMLDARRCISYQTIESKYSFNEQEFKIDRSGRIFGCDICLEACPWAVKGKPGSWEEFKPLAYKDGKDITLMNSDDWLQMEEQEFKEFFGESSLLRAGLARIKDNVLNSRL